jgi:acyl-CoA reductase-like NAD-dependent aldehyde dehydrogenase
MKVVKNYINGEWTDSETREFGEVRCPATGDKIGEVPFSTMTSKIRVCVMGTCSEGLTI